MEYISNTGLRVAILATILSTIGFTAVAERCTARTARQSVNTDTLCSCTVVTRSMLRVIQYRSDFENILAKTSAECPEFAFVLSDVQTVSSSKDENKDNREVATGKPSLIDFSKDGEYDKLARQGHAEEHRAEVEGEEPEIERRQNRSDDSDGINTSAGIANSGDGNSAENGGNSGNAEDSNDNSFTESEATSHKERKGNNGHGNGPENASPGRGRKANDDER